MTTLQFPPDFLFGSATAAFQIEGGGDADGTGTLDLGRLL